MTNQSSKKLKRIFIIGAGMSAECGAPLTRDFLKHSFLKYVKGKKLNLASEFISSVYKNHTEPNIEEVWGRIDRAIINGEIIAGYDHGKLREVREALLDVLIKILSSVHHRMEETLEWCGVFLDFWPISRDRVYSLKEFLENPNKWLESFLKQNLSKFKYRQEFLQLLIKHNNSQDLRSALTHFLSQPDFGSLKFTKNCVDNLVRLLFTPIKFHPIGIRNLFLYRLTKIMSKDVCGTIGLVSHWEPDSEKIFDELLWRIYLLRNYKERLDELNGWLNTYYLLVNMLREGDTVITTNYDIFLEKALLWLEERAMKYGVLWGTDHWEISDEVHMKYIPGTVENYAIYEKKWGGYLDGAYKRMSDAMKKTNKMETQRARKEYEKLLKRWKIRQNPNNWLSVLKLHGSLDWGICRSCQELFVMRSIPFYQAKSTILMHRIYSKAHRKHFLCCPHVKLDPLMVPPTWMKDYDNKVLVNIWRHAEERLCRASSIVFLGYSMPSVDEKIRFLFHKALYNRGGKPWNEIVVVNRSTEKVLPEYKGVFGNVRPITWNVSNYLRNIAKGRNKQVK